MIDINAIQQAVRDVATINRRFTSRDDKIAAKRQLIKELDAEVRNAPTHAHMAQSMKALNRANAALDTMLNNTHDDTDDLLETLDALLETVHKARSKAVELSDEDSTALAA